MSTDRDVLRNVSFHDLCESLVATLVNLNQADAIKSLVHNEQKIELIKLIRTSFYYSDYGDILSVIDCEDMEDVARLVAKGYVVTYVPNDESKLGLLEAKRLADYIFSTWKHRPSY